MRLHSRYALTTAGLALTAVATVSAQPRPEVAGTWEGSLTNLPARAGAPSVHVTREIGLLPTADSACTTFRTTYREGGVVKQVKDYQYCRGSGADDAFIDEGGGLRLAARWIGDVFVSPFKYDSLLLISSMRVREDTLEEEILTIDDRPAIAGVQPLRARSIQRLELRRVR